MPEAGNERLPQADGEWLDRSQTLNFTFEGRHYAGYAGDCLSSALWANGQRVLGRSFKYHRARGVYSLGGQDANVILSTPETPNIRGDLTPLTAGLDLRAVNTVGGVDRDWARYTDRMSKLLPVGFYYKAFHTPSWLFPRWERLIRNMAGLGAVNPAARTGPSPKCYDQCDVLVIGAGGSGMSAALAAADAGARVVLVDEWPHAGGSLAYAGTTAAAEARQSLLARVVAHSGISLRLGTAARGCYSDNLVALCDARKLTKMRAGAVVVATGAAPQPAVFRNNDLPGVMLGTAAQRLLHLYRVRPLRHAVLLAGEDDAYQLAVQLHQAGVKVAAIADLRPEVRGEVTAAVKDLNIQIWPGHGIYEAAPSRRQAGVRAARLARLDARSEPDAEIACDGIIMQVGWAPTVDLIGQAGGRLVYDEVRDQFLADEKPAGMFAAGRADGVFELQTKLAHGNAIGRAAAAHARGETTETPARPPPSGAQRADPQPIAMHPHGKDFIDLDEDVQVKDIINAVREGFASAELAKRYTTVGMGPSQGKLSNINASRTLAQTTCRQMAEIGYTTFRPFTQPTSIAQLAGRRFHPERCTPLHARHAAAGATFLHVGAWLRPAAYLQQDERLADAIVREVLALRGAAGLIDVGTLGKIDVCGPDAGDFLERLYTGSFANLAVGRSRYALMCDESGVVVDDGMVARLAEDRFYVTATTSGAAGVVRNMKRWAIEWRSRVEIIDLTGQLAAVNLAGPHARKILSKLTDLPLGGGSFPFLGCRQATVAAVPVRLLRVGFVGEWGCELHFPSHCAGHLWDALLAADETAGLTRVGVEAQRVLRLEKGHVIIGQDTDGLTIPAEAGLQWAVHLAKPFFVGQRSLQILAKRRLARQLVGFRLASRRPLVRECHLVIDGGEITGRVTSVTDSPSTKEVIGLAYVHPRQAELGNTFTIRAEGGVELAATVVAPPFYDPGNQRQKESS